MKKLRLQRNSEYVQKAVKGLYSNFKGSFVLMEQSLKILNELPSGLLRNNYRKHLKILNRCLFLLRKINKKKEGVSLLEIESSFHKRIFKIRMELSSLVDELEQSKDPEIIDLRKKEEPLQEVLSLLREIL